MSDIAIRVENISKKYILQHQVGGRSRYVALRDVLAHKAKSLFQKNRANASREEFWALKDVSFDIKQGEAVGIIGRNGAGKSTLLKILSRITRPTKGRIEIEGRVASLLEVGTGFHPELTGRENIFLNGAILGMHRAEIKKKFDEIVAFAEVEKFLDTPVKRFSSGMYMRLAFAVAAHLEPEILIVDEVLAVGDAQFQKKCLGKMQAVSKSEGRTVLFVSHNIQAIRQLCSSVILLRNGRVAHEGDPHSGINAYVNQGSQDQAAVVDLATYPRSGVADGVRMLTVKFMDEAGRPAFSVPWDSQLKVEVRFRVERQMKRLNVAMAVIHAEGLRVFSEAYSDQFPVQVLEPGEYISQMSIPLRFFKMESYFFTVGLFDDGRYGDFVEGLPMPQLVNENADTAMESSRWGVVRIPVAWQPLARVEDAGKEQKND